MKLILTKNFTCWTCPPLHYSAFVFALLYHTKIDISNPPSIAMVITATATATAVVSVIASTMKYNICHLLSRSLGFEEKRAVGRKEKYMLSSFAYTSQQPFAYFRKEVNYVLFVWSHVEEGAVTCLEGSFMRHWTQAKVISHVVRVC